MKIRSKDLAHEEELIAIYYPEAPKLDCHYERPHSPEPDAPTILPRRDFGFYICCNKVYDSHIKALDHWLDLHFLPFKGTMNINAPHGLLPSFYYPPNPCKSRADLINKSISLVARTEYYLIQMKNIPVTPSRFRPAPHTKPPHDFKNPYTAVLAMAYDFIETVLSGAKEYHLFLSLILDNPNIDFGHDLSKHIVYFPFWADYCYPCLPKVIAAVPPSLPPPENKPPPIPTDQLCRGRRDADGYYVCPTPGCGKKYKQPNGLKYHLNKGQCTVINMETGERPSMDIRKCVDCPFLPCSSSFSTPNGLKYHLFKNHLKKEHFNYGDGDLLPSYTCPVYSCRRSFSTSDNLRRHLLECHVRPTELSRKLGSPST
ncbi:hypothetical protein DSO57_1030913 [Entomophthora muscae]|uniref:Uncharacterized protein n=1 Tax=Entomophthora muscae TaxID=34485 RepID=A0ACC2S2V3_9FUNG|nr:hypothetical protein DSO57_1030913 [Entomophthora muscae]